eukprot:2018053-Pleurochrysis_carterae.AAC.1
MVLIETRMLLLFARAQATCQDYDETLDIHTPRVLAVNPQNVKDVLYVPPVFPTLYSFQDEL